MQKKPFFIANWKMKLTSPLQEVNLAVSLARELKTVKKGYGTVVACPSFLGIGLMAGKKITPLALGAQDCFWELEGAFTGEISPSALHKMGCSMVILGHSERRLYLGESNAMVHEKVKAVTSLKGKLVPVVCVGENIEERNSGKTLDVIRHQLKEAFSELVFARNQEIIIAYEPVWAIGSGKSVAVEDCRQVYTEIMALFALWYPDLVKRKAVSVIYGGSVTRENVGDFVTEGVADGVLVGGASLKAKGFASLIKACR